MKKEICISCQNLKLAHLFTRIIRLYVQCHEIKKQVGATANILKMVENKLCSQKQFSVTLCPCRIFLLLSLLQGDFKCKQSLPKPMDHHFLRSGTETLKCISFPPDNPRPVLRVITVKTNLINYLTNSLEIYLKHFMKVMC